MKLHPFALLALLALLFSPGCASNGTLTPQGQQAITTGLGVAQIALNTYLGYEAAKSGGSVSTSQTAALAQNALYGIAQLAQANVGTTPAAANIAAGAGNPVVGSAVQSAIPQTPLTQATVQTLYNAAAAVPKATPASAQVTPSRLPTLYYGDQRIPGPKVVTRLDP